MRRYTKTWIYVGREYLFSFTVAFLFFFFIFFVNQILLYAETIFAKKVPFVEVMLFIVYNLPVVIALAFPFGALVGALMAVGRFASDNEFLAFSVLGIPERQLLVPLLVLGIAFSSVSFIMNDYFFPLSNIRMAQMYRRIIYSNPALELEPHSIKKYENTVIVTGGVEGKSIEDVTIFDRTPEQSRRVIIAGSASLTESEETKGVVTLGLKDVLSQVGYPKEGDRYDYFTADSMQYSILLKNITGAISGTTPQSQSSLDVWRQIQKMRKDQAEKVRSRDEKTAALLYGMASAIRAARERAVGDPSSLALEKRNIDALQKAMQAEKTRDVANRALQGYLVEFHRKFSLPIACLVFSFFAFPIGIMARRSGRTVGFAVGLLVSIIYYGLLLMGQTFGGRMEMSPALSMWLPDMVVLAAGAVVFVVRYAAR